MPRPSKVQDSGFEEEVINLHLQQYSNNRIAEELKAKGFNVSGRAVERFLEGKGYESKGQKITYDKTLQSGNCKTKDEQILNPTLIDVNEVLSDLNIKENLTDIDNIVSSSQKMAWKIYLFKFAILCKKLEMHSQGLCKYPSEEARGYKIGAEVMQAMWGYNQVVNLAQAMKTLEQAGYTIN